MRAGIYWGREGFVLGFIDTALREAPPSAWRCGTSHKQVPDPELRRRVTPTYTIGCKRILISNDYYPALGQPNVELVTDGITEVAPNAIVTADGAEHEVDTIIFGTGFHVTDLPVGRGRPRAGRSHAGRELERRHAGVPRHDHRRLPEPVLPRRPQHRPRPQLDGVHDRVARSTTCSTRCARWTRRGAASVEVRPEAQAAFNDRRPGADARHGVEHGRLLELVPRRATAATPMLWPGFTWPFRRLLRHFDPEHYELRAPTRAPEPVATPAWRDAARVPQRRRALAIADVINALAGLRGRAA